MIVTCKICRKKIDKDEAYKIVTIGPINGKKTNSYYCSQAEWQAEEDRKQKAKEDKDKVYYLICDMFGYEIQNTKFFDEWARWNKLKSNEIIYKYLRENETYLQTVCDKSFNNECQKIMYFSTILKNSLMDYIPKADVVEKPKIAVEEAIYEAPTQSVNRRRSLAELEDMF